MLNYIVKPSAKLHGTITIPPSKSHTLRAILFASLARGISKIHHYLHSPDTTAMIQACKLLGAKITVNSDLLIVEGTAGSPSVPDNIIDAGNSGQVLRFIAAIAALLPSYTVLTGDHSIRSKRPIKPLLDALTQLNTFAVSTRGNGYAPIMIKGPLQSGKTSLSGEDSQPVSGLLIASAFAKGQIEISVTNPGEKPWIDLTLDWFERLGIPYINENYEHYVMYGNAQVKGFEYIVPADFSSAAFPIVAALITQSEITLQYIDMNDIQGDKAIIPVLQEMGANISYDDEKHLLHIQPSEQLTGKIINVNDFVDAIPILSVVGCFAKGTTQIVGGAIAKHKESDRLVAMTNELRKMGASISDNEDGLIIHHSVLKGAEVQSYHDHRIAMSLAVAGLIAKSETIIKDVACVAKTFPNFAGSIKSLGMNITEEDM